MLGLSDADIDIASRGADEFIHVYYNAYDSKDRLQILPKFYRPSSIVAWNGNLAQGELEVQELLEKMPVTKHEVQSFDCHPIPNSSLPGLLVTVSGTVIHGQAASITHPTSSKAVDDQPRIFTQNFMLVPETEGIESYSDRGHPRYYILSDVLRFVG